MTLTEETENQINEHVTRLNQEAKAPWHTKLQSYVTALSIVTAVIGLYQWQDKKYELQIAISNIETNRQIAENEKKIHETELNYIKSESEKLKVENKASKNNLTMLQAQNSSLRESAQNFVFEIIELVKQIGKEESELKKAKALKERANTEKEKLKKESGKAIKDKNDALFLKEETEDKISDIRAKLGKYANYIEKSGHYTKDALRDLISLKYIKTPRKIFGYNIPFVRPYTISVFLTYPEFAQEQLDKQILSVSYPGVKLKGDKPLIIREKVSDGGLRFLGAYDGSNVPTNLTAIIKFATLKSEDTINLKQCSKAGVKETCEDSVTIIKVDN